MKALVQRVSQASVSVQGKELGSIKQGLLVLLGVTNQDSEQNARLLARKLLTLRIFAGGNKDMNRSIVEAKGEILLVSQFTLCSRTDKGNRPSFVDAAEPERAETLYRLVQTELSQEVPVQTGQFGSYMDVALHNDGPVTLLLDI